MRRGILILLALCFFRPILWGQWELVNIDQMDTLQGLTFRDICFINRDTGFVVGAKLVGRSNRGLVLRTFNRGASWQIVHNTNSYSTTCVFKNNVTGYLGSSHCLHSGYTILEETWDGGKSWEESNLYIDKENTDEINIQFINELRGFIAIRDRIYQTIDGGETWDTLLIGHYVGSSIFFFADGKGWATGDLGRIIKIDETGQVIIVTSDTPLPLNKVVFINKACGWIAGGYSNNDGFKSILLKTTNGGEQWDEIPGMNYLIHDLLPFSESLLWAVGEDKGRKGVIIKSKDGGNTWVKLKENLSGPLYAIEFKEGVGWAVGRNGLILKNENSGYIVSTESAVNDKRKHNLLQNYPNPFRSSTVISYKLQVESRIQIDIYDFTGRRKTTLINETQPAGNHELTWNAEGLKPGIYFCELNTGQSRMVQKMVLLK